MNSALIEIGDPDINKKRVIQPVQFKFSRRFIRKIRKQLHAAKDIIATLVPDLDNVYLNYNGYLKDIIHCWEEEYNFRQIEKVFNQYPHFYTTIDDCKIHYIHVKPNNPDKKLVFPLLMLHGWPSSILEFYYIIPFLLEAQNDFIFEVIIPSLPGFGGSDCLSHKKLNCENIAELLVKLMKVLGFDRFYVHCDDWCVFIVYAMSKDYSYNVMAVHYALSQVDEFTNLQYYITNKFNYNIVYKIKLTLQEKYPHLPTSLCTLTLGMSVLHSPVTLLAYLFEKFVKDSIHLDTVDLLGRYKNYGQLLNTVMMYWATDSIIKTLKAYSGYFTFNEESPALLYANNVPDYVHCVSYVGVTLFLYRSKMNDCTIRQSNYSVLTIRSKKNSYRFPAVEAPVKLARAIFTHFERFQQETAND